MIYDRVYSIAVTCNGAGNSTWTAAVTQHALPPTGLSNKWVKYTQLDSAGVKWETGRAQLSESAGTYTLTRGGSQIVSASSNAGAAESFSNTSTHKIFIAPDAEFFNNAEILLETQTASASANINFDLPAGFSEYVLKLREVAPATDAQAFRFNASTDTGSTYLTTSGDVYYRYNRYFSDTTEAESSSKTTTTGAELFNSVGNVSTEALETEIRLVHCASTALYKLARYGMTVMHSGGEVGHVWGSVAFRTTSAVDNVKFEFASGNIASGTFKLYGIVD